MKNFLEKIKEYFLIRKEAFFNSIFKWFFKKLKHKSFIAVLEYEKIESAITIKYIERMEYMFHKEAWKELEIKVANLNLDYNVVKSTIKYKIEIKNTGKVQM